MSEELDDAHFLSGQLISDRRARRVAVRPRAAVDQMQRTCAWRRAVAAVVPETVLEAAVPALQRARQRRTLHVHVHPVTTERESRAENLKKGIAG